MPVTIVCQVCGREKKVRPKDAHFRACSPPCSGILKQKKWEQAMAERYGEPFPQLLERLYTHERNSTTQIARFLGLADGAPNVGRWLRRYGIPLRNASERISISWEGNEERREWAAKNLADQAVNHYARGVATRAAMYRAKPNRWEKLAIEHFTSLGESFEFQVAFDIYIADFVFPDRLLILEVDSQHHNIPHIAERDERRTEYLNSLGYQVKRVRVTQERSIITFRRHLDEALAS